MQPKLRLLWMTLGVILMTLFATVSHAQYKENVGSSTVTTDKPDYAPRSNAVFTGKGFLPGDSVKLKVRNLTRACNTIDHTDSSYQTWAVVADASGSFVTNWTVCDCNGDSLRLRAVGVSSHDTAYAYFSDAGDKYVIENNEVSAANICASSSAVRIHSFKLTGSGNAKDITGITFTTLGDYLPSEILNFKLYYTTTNSFSATNLLSTISSPSGAGSQVFSLNFPHKNSSLYYWITMDVASNVIDGHTLSVNSTSAGNITTSTIDITGSGNASGTQTLNSIGSPSISISASPGTSICSGTPETFTAIPTKGGTTPSYQWILNGSPVGTNSDTYTNSSLANNDVVAVSMTSNAACASPATATSSVTMVVTPKVTPSVSISITSGTNPTCAGNSVTFTANPTNGGPNPSYVWKKGSTTVSTTDTYTDPAIAGTGGTITLTMTSSLSCLTTTLDPKASQVLVINVLGTPLKPSPDNNTICQGSSPINFSTSTVPNATSYTWTVTGTGNSISGTGTSATVTWASGFSGDAFIIVKANGCNTSTTSPTSTIHVRPTPTAIISGTTSVCQGDNSPQISINNPLAFGIKVFYKVNSGTPISVTVPANSLSTISAPTNVVGIFDYNLISAEYSDIANFCKSTISGTASVTVNNPPKASITSVNTSICNGGSSNITGNVTASGNWILTLSNGATATGTGTTTFSISVHPSTTTTYTIISLTDANCSALANGLTGSTEVTVKNVIASNAGGDQSITGPTATLVGNNPMPGTGQWTIVGTPNDGTFADATAYNTTFTGVEGKTYTLRWTITNAPCATSLDDVIITLKPSAIGTVTTIEAANATYGDASVNLVAHLSPAAATGTMEFYVNGTFKGTATVTGGIATYNYSLSGVNAGPYTLKVKYLGAGVYTTSETDPETAGGLMLNKVSLTVTADNQTKIYGAANPTLTATITGFVNGETLATSGVSGTASLTTSADETSGVGTYTISAAAGTLASGNYDFTFVPGTLTVGTRPITLKANNRTKVYGEELALGSTDYSIAVGSLVNGNTITGVTLTSAGAAATATVTTPGPVYPISITDAVGSGLENYNISYNNTATLTIETRPITLKANNRTKVYGEELALGSTDYSIAVGSLVNGNTITGVTLTSAGAAATATVTTPGPVYPISITDAVGSGLENYNISYNNTATLTIETRPITLKANNRTKVYGEELALGSTDYSIAVGSLVNGNTITGVTLTSAGAAATATVTTPGPVYPISITDAVGSGLENYNISYNNTATLTIETRPITLKANNRTKVYGEELALGSTDYSIAVGSLVNGNTITGVTLTSAGAAATATVTTPGPVYPISITDAVGSGLENYNISYNNTATLTIETRPITLKANNRTKVYGEELALGSTDYSIAVGSLVNGNTITGVTLTSAGAAATATVTTPGPVYPISITDAVGSGLENYNISYNNTATLTIETRPITLKANNRTKVYGEELALGSTDYSIAVGSLVNGNTITGVTLTSAGAAATATVTTPGPVYPISITDAVGSGLENYNISYNNTATLTIETRPITLKANNRTKVYGEELALGSTDYSIAVGSLVNGNTITGVTLTSAGAAATATVTTPGPVYPISITDAVGSGLENYNISYNNTATLTIETRPITLKANNRTKVYGEELALGSTDYSIAVGSLVNGNTITGVTLTSAGAAATATVTTPGPVYPISITDAVGSGLENYNISYNNTATLTIETRPITLKANNRTKVYGEELALGSTDYSIAVGSLVNGNTITGVTLTSAGAAATATVTTPGPVYPISITDAVGSGLENYNISYNNTATLTIETRPITLKANNRTKVYGEELALGSTDYSIAVGSLVNGNTITGVTLTSAGAAATATVTTPGPVYPISITDAVGSGLENYNISYNNTATLTIETRPITLKANNRTKVYGEELALGSTDYSIAVGSLVNGNTITGVTLTSAGAAATATVTTPGPVYPISITDAVGSGLENYNISYNNTATLTIETRPITLKANNRTKVYGEELALGSTDYSIAVGSLVNGNTITGVTLTSAGAAATATVTTPGPVYPISITDAVGSGLENYNISYNNTATLTIETRPITLKANNRTKVYGEELALGSTDYSIAVGSLVNGNTITGVTLTSAGAAATATVTTPGPVYPISITDAVGSGLENYNISYNNTATLTIETRPITLKANNRTKVYGEELALGSTDYSIAVGSLVNGNTITGVTLTSAGAAATATVTTPGPVYPISITDAVGSGLENYNISYNNTATLTIETRPITLKANNRTKVYGEELALGSTDYSIAVGSLVNGNTITGVTLTSAGAAATATVTTPGPVYPISITDAVGSGLENYNISYNNTATLTIETRPITLKANNRTKVYGEELALGSTDYSIAVGSLVNGNTITGVTLTSAGAAATATVTTPGPVYPISITDAVGSGLENYNISYNNTATLTIETRPITLKANNRTKVYGEELALGSTDYSIAVGSLVNGNTITGVTLTSAGAAATATVTTPGPVYPISITDAVGSGLENYNISYNNTATLTIETRPITLKANNRTKVYGEELALGSTDYSIAVGSLVNGNTITGVTLTSAGAAATATVTTPGPVYPISITDAVGSGLENYNISYNNTATLTIETRPITLKANNRTKVYGEELALGSTDYSIAVGSLVNGNTITGVTLTSAGAAATATVTTPGPVYPISITDAVGSGLENYNISYNNTATLTIETRPITLKANNRTKVYGEELALGSTDYSIAVGSLVNGNTITGVTLTSAGAAATATVTTPGPVYPISITDAVGSGLENYNISYNNTATLTIETRPITLKANNRTKVYGEELALGSTDYSIAVGSLVNGNTITGVTLTSAGAAATATVTTPGPVYPISITDAVGSGLENYNISYNNTATLTIETRPITLKANNRTKVYGEELALGSTDYSIAVGSLVNGNTITGVTLTSAGAAATATVTTPGPVYPISITDAVGSGLENYNISYNNTATLTIETRPITLKANNRTKVYGEELALGSTDYSIAVGSLVNGNTITGVTLTSAGAAATATVTTPGPVYPISITDAVGSGLENYNISYNNTATLTIETRPITLKANNRTKVYGEELALGSTDYSIAVGSLVNGNTITGVTLTSAGAAATATVTTPGPVYPISITDAVGSGLENYNISYNNTATLTIETRPITLKANNRTKVYGEELALGSTDYSIAVGSLVNGNTITGVTLTSAGAAATATVTTPGPVYPISITDAVGSGLENYNISYNNTATLTIETRPITLKANNRTKVYGEELALGSTDYSIAVGSLVNGNTITGVTLTSAGAAATATVTTPGPVYPISITDAVGSGLENYNISYNNTATLTISKASLVVNATNVQILCGQDIPTFTGTYIGAKNNETFIVGGTTTEILNSGVGTYPITPTISGSTLGNYELSQINGVLKINGVNIDGNSNVTPQAMKSTVTSVTFKVTTSTNAIAPNVKVSLYVDNATTCKTATSDQYGIATFNLGVLAADVYRLRAVVGAGCTETTVYMPVYDPSGGFITGGGWINSPIYQNLPYMKVAGKANFGFVSKYEKGKSVPTGNTEFQFKEGDMNFSSSSYDWLVVSGGKKGQYKGTGTINGTGSYGFILTATDGDAASPKTADLFRIKIYNKVTNAVVYDNQYGTGTTPDDAEPTTAIEGGSIVIHDNNSKTVTAAKITNLNVEVAPEMVLKAYPNPSPSQFNLKLQTNNREEKIQVRVLDLNGRVVELFNNLSANQSLQIGANYRPSMYIVEMIQGNERKQLKLVKQPN